MLNTRQQIAGETAAGRFAAAEAEYRDVLAARLRILGPDHPDTLATRHNIAGEMAARGDHAAAQTQSGMCWPRSYSAGPDHASIRRISLCLDDLKSRRSV